MSFFQQKYSTTDYSPFGVPLYGRNWTAENGYRYGFNGKEKDDEVKGSGNSYDYGARMYDSRLGRWLGMDPKSGKFAMDSPYMYGGNSPVIMTDAYGEEKIIIIGSQFDESSGNKLMFANQAVRQAKDYNQQSPQESKTMLIFSQGYSNDQLDAIRLSAKENNVSIIEVKTASDVVNYLNNKSLNPVQNFIGETPEASDARSADQITQVDIFAHGLKGSIEFGYGSPNENYSANASFTAGNALNMIKGAFSENASIYSWACQTANGGNQSLASYIAQNSGATTFGFEKRTTYENTLSSLTDRLFLKSVEGGLVSRFATSSGMNYRQWQNRLENRKSINGATFDPEGAIHPVSVGDTPFFKSDDQQKFEGGKSNIIIGVNQD